MKQQEGAAALRGKLIPVAAISFFRSLHKSMKLNGDSIWTCVVLTAQSKSCRIYCRELLYILSRGFYFSQSQTLSCLQPPMNAQFGSFVLNSDYVQELIWRLIETPLYPRWRAKMNWYWCGFAASASVAEERGVLVLSAAWLHIFYFYLILILHTAFSSASLPPPHPPTHSDFRHVGHYLSQRLWPIRVWQPHLARHAELQPPWSDE